MQFDQQPRRDRPENIVPMINVVFLLLIFFLMTAQIVPPAPIDVTPPAAEGAALDPDTALYAGADGALAYGEARGDAVFDLLAERPTDAPLQLRADAGLPGGDLAALMARLARIGQGRVTLVVSPR